MIVPLTGHDIMSIVSSSAEVWSSPDHLLFACSGMKEPDPVRFPFLGGGVIEFMFNRKEARLDPVF